MRSPSSSMPATPDLSRHEQATLKRALSLPLITLYGLGTIVGAGIYVLIGEVAGVAGIYAPAAFLLAALVAGFNAFTYAELVARHPKSAAEAVYVQAAFGRRWLSGLAGWSVVVVGIVSAATIVNGFVGYAELFAAWPDWLLMLSLVLLLAAVAAWGIAESVWIAAIVTIVEVGGLVLVLWVTESEWLGSGERWLSYAPPMRLEAWTGIGLGAFLAFYAFIGFEDMVNVAEEVKNPRRNIPSAIILALVLSSVLYLLVAVAAVLALPMEELAHSGAPLAKIVEHSGYPTHWIGVISIIAIVNGALIQIIMASRMLYGMGRQQMAPAVFAGVNAYTRTPVTATAFAATLVLVFGLWLPIVTLAQATSFVTLLLFALMNVSLYRLKRREPAPRGIAVYPLWVPIVAFLMCAGLLAVQLVSALR